jgi:methyltransferase (TIGR00027 family)
MRPSGGGRLRSSLVARTRFFDQLVLKAISEGMGQVVICGAGYDDRALRFRAPAVTYFELDLPATQTDKAARLRGMGADVRGLTLIPVDFRRDDLSILLRGASFQAGRPALFLCEGLLVYLDREEVLRLLQGLRLVAFRGSRLAASLATLPEGHDSARAVATLNRQRRTGTKEPWLTVLSIDGWLSLFSDSGWRPDGISAAGGRTGGMLLLTCEPDTHF